MELRGTERHTERSKEKKRRGVGGKGALQNTLTILYFWKHKEGTVISDTTKEGRKTRGLSEFMNTTFVWRGALKIFGYHMCAHEPK